MRVGFIHTSAHLLEIYRSELARAHPQLDTYHILNESLIQGLRRGEPRQLMYRAVMRQILLAVEGGGDLVVHTGISTSAAVELARSVSVIPIVNAADPTAAEAVRLGRRIALVATTTTSPGPGATLLRQHAAAQRKEVFIETVVRPEAYTAWYAGDPDRHDAILLEAAQEVAGRVDVLVLLQGTLLHMQKPLSRLGKPVLASPPLLMNELTRRLAMPQPPL